MDMHSYLVGVVVCSLYFLRPLENGFDGIFC